MSTLPDTLRLNLQNLDEAIRHARICIRTNDKRKAEFLAEYLRLIRFVDGLREEGEAAGATGELWVQSMPMPFAEQVVGADKFNREWASELRAVPPVNTAPLAHRRAA